jgi:hypothetical protein
MNSREQSDALSAAVLWPSASVDKRGSSAPKGQQIRRDRLRFLPTTTRINQTDSGATREAVLGLPSPNCTPPRGVGSAFRARSPRTINPGLKPWAMMFNRFAVSP